MVDLEQEHTPLRTGNRASATLAVLVAASAAFAVLQGMVIPVLHELQSIFDTDFRNITLVVSAYLLSASIATPIVGRLGDAIGKRRMFVIALGMLAAGSFLAAVAPNLAVLVIARVIQGVGGGVVALAFAIIRDVCPARRVPFSIGIVSAVGGIGAAVGLVLAGPIMDLLGYRWLFILPGIVCTATLLAALVVIERSATRPSPISWLPAPLLAVFLGTFVVATTYASSWGWADPRTLGLYLISALFGVAWYTAECRVAHPVIDPQMLRLPTVRAGNVVGILLGFTMLTVYAFVPLMLQAPATTTYGFGASVTQSGLLMLPLATAVFAGGLIAARLERRIGARRTVFLASTVIALCLGIVAIAHGQLWEIGVILCVYGVALGLALASLSTLVVVSVPATQSAVAGAVNVNLRTMGGAVGTAVVASVVAAQVDPDGLPYDSGYTAAYAILAITMAIAAALSLTIPRARERAVA